LDAAPELPIDAIQRARRRLVADSDDISHRFRSKPATYSERSQPGIPMIPAA
jgi:hypothetical protein